MFYCMKQVIPVLRAQQSGCIVNVASTSARTGLPLRSAFVASMAGILGLTQNAARELGPDQVRCNAVLPGVLLDDRSRALVEARARERRISLEEAEAELLSHVSMRSWIEESEVAETVLFLASDRARHITGQTIGVCGNVEWEG
jgi:NAD(P)-dependent dehydrogenase (short-subunit alcohol dehydrogenase family)